MTANHRANDIIVKEGMPQIITARFMYGPLDMVALSGEKVIIMQSNCNKVHNVFIPIKFSFI